MCGIAVVLKPLETDVPVSTVDRMRDAVEHRGPDDKGSTFFGRNGTSGWSLIASPNRGWQLGLAHRRLSILDVSASGHQPMVYREKFWTVYNGEIYNFVELREELRTQGHVFRSGSDTEVVLAAYAEWGTACFARFRGMWGLAIVDLVRGELVLSRDRLGIKPLYVWQTADVLAVTSEIKQLLHLPGFRARFNPEAAEEYLNTGYEDRSRTFFEGVQPHAAASWTRIPLNAPRQQITQEYWFPARVSVSIHDATEAGRLFAAKIDECVRLHMRSDVPVGCALSGGLDSSTIATLAANRTDGATSPGQRLQTFTITFPGYSKDEREYADLIAAKIAGVQHFTVPDPLRFLDDVNSFVWMHDEPVGSLQMYAGYCLARLCRAEGVPVLLNGQGGDEVLSGYWQCYLLHLLDLVRVGNVFTAASHFVGALSTGGNETLWRQLPIMLRRFRARKTPPFEANFGSSVTRRPDRETFLGWILSMNPRARRVHEVQSIFLPRLLKWEDRNSMAFSVEGRYPFLDHELIELCLSFAPHTLYHKGWTKYPLRLGLQELLPSQVAQRRSKFGLETPQDNWLRGALKPTIECWLKNIRPVWDYVDRDSVRRLAESAWRSQEEHEEAGQAIVRLFFFDKWLEVFGADAH
jgi:asparagine synthase (glutamine-hydrolysing)